ncbi:putative mycocerosic acid synthase [Colletotrichum sublineola]|uniref:Putative mycocerosic acid synthase n=1 Tax=Colletotrichum sublineola TaxID=1173701 RepID=A0A066X7H1_COLSU|nr:putative mycocerosic acid synthase [Colletotrichum sublineola]
MASDGSKGGRDEPVAIIGMACRFPGEATNPSKFWELLKDGRDAFSEADRFNPEAFYHANSSGRQNVLPCKGAHFLQGSPYAFDAAFFNITPGEALATDPRQRLALEVAYEALENSGLPPHRVAGTRTACFMGAAANMAEYKDGIVRDFGNQPQHLIMGISEELMSNRLSHFFDLHGPSATVETACSSSLVAVHLACQSLRAGESNMAIAGGVNLLLSPDTFMQLQNLSVLSPEGRSRSFDENGRGYGRGEGCGIVVLKRLSTALSDGDPIRAIIRATGCNSDGWTKGMALPSGESQMQLIKDVYDTFGLDYSLTQYVEAHGTGTKAGDPTEAHAIYNTIGRATRNQKLIMGSVKPNINRNIPLDEWNMEIPTRLTAWPVAQSRRMSVSSFGLGGTNAHVVMEAHNSRVIRDHGSNGSKSGITCHRKRLFVLSSQDKGGFDRIGNSLVRHLDGLGPLAASSEYLADLAHTLAVARSGLGWVSSFVAESLAEVRERLNLGAGQGATRRRRSEKDKDNAPRLAFVFTGQGAQWAGMGLELLQRPVFAASVAASTAHLARLGCEWDPVEEVRKSGDMSRLSSPEISQAVCTILQIGLVDELRSWGIRPAKVIGHSSGEIAAAYCLGALTHADAIAAAYFRGKASAAVVATSTSTGRGMGMMAIGCSREKAEKLIASHDGSIGVTVACVNSPGSITLSGDAAELDQLARVLQEQNIFHRRLKVEVAYHSALMAPVSETYLSSIADIQPREETDPLSGGTVMISSVTASEATPDMLGPYYWLANMLSPVLFSEGIHELVRPSDPDNAEKDAGNTVDMMIEIGPHSTLAGPVAQTLSHHGLGEVEYRSVLFRGHDAVETALQLARGLFHAGVALNIAAVNGDKDLGTSLLTDLPPYPWNHDRLFDATSRIQKEYLHRQLPRRSLLGTQMPTVHQTQRVWRSHVRLEEEPWLRGHKVGVTVVLPAAAMLSIAIEGGCQIAEAGKTLHAIRLRDVSFFAALALPESTATELVLTIRPHLLGTVGHGTTAGTSSWWEFLISSSVGTTSPLRDNCGGLLSLDYCEDRSEHTRREDEHLAAEKTGEYRATLDAFRSETYAPDDFYRHLAELGFQYDGHFRSVEDIHPGAGRATFGVRLSSLEETFSAGQLEGEEGQQRPFLVHGAALDAIFQAWTGSTMRGGRIGAEKPYAPTFVAEMEVSAGFPAPKGQLLPGMCVSRCSGFNEWSVDASLFGDESLSSLCLSFKDFRLSELDAASAAAGAVTATKSSGVAALTASVQWDDSLDVMTPEEVADAISDTVAGAAAPSARERLARLVGLVLHGMNPAATAVELVRQGAEPRLLAEMPLASCVMYVAADGEGGERADREDGQVVSLASASGVEDAFRHELQSAGLLLIPSWAAEVLPMTKEGVLERLVSLAAPEATVVLGAALPSITSVLEASGFRRSPVSHSRHGGHDSAVDLGPLANGAPVLYRRRESMPREMQDVTEHIVVVEPAVATEMAELCVGTLLKALELYGDVVRHRWAIDRSTTAAETAFAGRTVVCMLELEQPFLESMSDLELQTVKTMMLQSARMVWVTRGDDPSLHIVDGLARCVRSENATADVRVLHLGTGPVENAPRHIARVVTVKSSADKEFREARGRLQVARIVEDRRGDAMVAEHLADSKRVVGLEEVDFPLKLAIGHPGLLDTFCFVKDNGGGMRDLLGDLDVEVQVHAASLNFKDIMAAMGMIALPALGSEASGIVVRTGSGVSNLQVGDRVALLCPEGTHKTLVRVDSSLVMRIPDSLTFEQAASIPVAFITAYHALVNVAKLSKGQSVLIHAAAGGVGQAAIQVASLLGLVVYATAGSRDKMAFLTECYGVPPSHIFYSRDASFAKAVARVTDKRGVDCVLNSLSGDLLHASWDCVAPFGVFVELGLRDVVNNTRLHMKPFHKNITFSFFDVKDLPMPTLAKLLNTIYDLVSHGRLTPVSPITAYSVDRVKEAYRTMQQGKHRGKIVLTFTPSARVPVLFPATDSLTLNPNVAYLLVGGLGGLGRSLAQLLVSCGARNLVFLSRSGLPNGSSAARDHIIKLKSIGAKTYVLRGDVADSKSFLAAMRRYEDEGQPPICGVIHLAAVLRDAVFENMTHDEWTAALRPKVQGSRNLDGYFNHSRPLDFFILCASVAGIWGNAGQTAYAAANTYQDALAHRRRAQGLAGVAVDLGIIRDVGMAAEQSFGTRFSQWAEVIGIPGAVFLALMKSLIKGQQQQQQSIGTNTYSSSDPEWPPPQVCSGLGSAEAWEAHDIAPPPAYLADPRFAALAGGSASGLQRRSGPGGGDAKASSSSSLASRLAGASTRDEAANVVADALVHKAAGILQIPPSEVDPSRPLYQYGVDSLVAIEVRNWINGAMKANVALLEIMGGESIRQFALKGTALLQRLVSMKNT